MARPIRSYPWQKAAPWLAGAAGVAALFALFVPIPAPEAKAPPSAPTPGPAADADTKPEDVVVKPEDWKALAALLENLREKPPEQPAVVETDTKEDDLPLPPPIPVPQPLAWKYRGFIQEPDRLVALVLVDGAQRFMVEGQVIADSDDPDSKITLVAVSPTQLVVNRGGREEKIAYEPAQTSAEPAPRGRMDPRLNPRGMRP